MLREEPSLVSPISVCYFEYYENDAHLKQLLTEQQDKIQCIVSGQRRIENSFDFGEAQCPKLNDFADGVNTLSFLKGI